ncbi:hypothetical protein [Empedobacter sp.]|uniref:hypothetical protein n=1 Tax=Empedobacter sp. TaxID=1927715 RepID=UPI002899882B|nr:hypothetical protein [Empedobacter sp.]
MSVTQVEIKNEILEKMKFFNNGFSDLFMDYTAERLVSYKENTSISYGIDDRFGNYFYLRNDGDIKVSKSRDRIIDHIPNIELSNPIVFVANVANADPNELLKCLLNSLGTNNEIEINKAFITNEKVIKSEYSFLNIDAQKNILSRIGDRSLVKISFTIFEIFQPNDRDCVKCNPCIDCL